MPLPPGFPSQGPLSPQHAERSEWSPRDYWVQEPRRIPPPPPFSAYVPAPEQLAFEELPRDASRLQPQPQGNYPQPPPVIPAPPIIGVNPPQQNARPDWTLRDYTATRDEFSARITPVLPPVNPNLAPQQNARPDWTLRDYSANQPWLGSFFGSTGAISPYVPAPEQFGFGELPRDMTVFHLVLIARSLATSAPSGRPLPRLEVVTFLTPPRDMTPERFVIDQLKLVNPGIPVVPPAEAFLSFDYEPLDMTPYLLVLATAYTAQQAGAQIPPAVLPFIESPGWQSNQYQSLQDRFSALATPVQPFFPPGLRPQFTLEALLRDIPRPLIEFRYTIIPPPPPFVFPTPVPWIEPPPWSLLNYQDLNDRFTAWVNSIPIPPPFRVMAVTAGYYAGIYYLPGDVFQLLSSADYSPSTINYGPNSATIQLGWMLQVPATTPLLQSIPNQQPPVFPPIDPARRFVY